MLDKFFKISERGSTVSNEVIGGLTTFLAMAYIIAVNPGDDGGGGIPFNAALTATCFGAAIMTVAMGLFANRPIALASGMGINAIVAYSLCSPRRGLARGHGRRVPGRHPHLAAGALRLA